MEAGLVTTAHDMESPIPLKQICMVTEHDIRRDCGLACYASALRRICQLIAAVGLERMDAPHIRHLTGPLWEMRIRERFMSPLGADGGSGARIPQEDATDTET